MTEPILEFTGEHRFLSNFWEHPLFVPGKGTCWDGSWPTAEHLFQAMKTTDHDEVQHVRAQRTPGAAKREGRRVTLRPDWEEIKVPCMQQVLVLKFSIGSDLGARLVETGDAILVEGNTWGDRFWGVYDGRGDNHLGRLLMQRRELLAALRLHDDMHSGRHNTVTVPWEKEKKKR